MNIRAAGMAVGMGVGILIAIILIKFFNRNKSLTTQYDERQKMIRGEAYKYAFYTLVIYEGILCVILTGRSLPVDPFVLHFGGIALGVAVQAGYSIWNGAYIGQNTNIRRFIITMILISVFNLVIGIMSWRDGFMIVDGVLQSTSVNLMFAVLFGILGIVGLIRKMVPVEDDE